MSSDSDYAMRARFPELDFEAAVARVTARLQDEGFGVLTEIDVRATLKKKLDVDFRRYLILGACNPQLAHRALREETEIGLLLPCNVIVYEEGAGSVVSIADPGAMLSVADQRSLRPIAREARERLERVLARMSSEPVDAEC